MDSTLHALGGLLLKAVPTAFFLVALTIYLKYVFFKPLERVLAARYKATEGARRLAEAALAAAGDKASAYDKAIQIARAELQREQEAQRQQWLAAQTETLASARAQAESRVDEARRELAEQTEDASAQLSAQAEELARHIMDTVLGRRAA